MYLGIGEEDISKLIIFNISCICLLINISFTQNIFMKISRSKASCYHNDEYILFFPQGKKLLISLQYAFWVALCLLISCALWLYFAFFFSHEKLRISYCIFRTWGVITYLTFHTGSDKSVLAVCIFLCYTFFFFLIFYVNKIRTSW